MFGRRRGKPTEYLAFLIVGQKRRSTGCGLGFESVVLIGSVPGDPLGDSDGVNAQERGYVFLRPALLNPANGDDAACL